MEELAQAHSLSPFASLNFKQQFGMWEPVTLSNPAGVSSAFAQQQAMPRCEVGGAAGASIVGVVVSATRGVMRSTTNPALPLQPTWQLRLACRTYQPDRISGRVSMFKHIVPVRVRYPPAAGSASGAGDDSSSSSSSSSYHYHFSKGDVLYVRGQLQLHSVYDLAARKWNCNGLCVDVAAGAGAGGEVAVVHSSSSNGATCCSLSSRVASLVDKETQAVVQPAEAQKQQEQPAAEQGSDVSL